MVDTHCHILPGLDDGSATFEESLEMARLAEEDGTKLLVATPHKGTASYDPPAEHVRTVAAELSSRMEAIGLHVRLTVGCELPITTDLMDLHNASELIPLGPDGRFLLIELPFNGYLGDLQQQLFSLELKGYRIVLAHPERSFACMHQNDLLPRLKDRGYWAQINAGSIAGQQGRRVRNLCIKWLREGLVDVIASDAHGATHRPPVMSVARKTVIKIGGDALWNTLTLNNPVEMLRSRRD